MRRLTIIVLINPNIDNSEILSLAEILKKQGHEVTIQENENLPLYEIVCDGKMFEGIAAGLRAAFIVDETERTRTDT